MHMKNVAPAQAGLQTARKTMVPSRVIRRFCAIGVVAAIGMLGHSPDAAAQSPLPLNVPIQSISLSPSATTLFVGQNQGVRATATLVYQGSPTTILGGGGPLSIWNLIVSPQIPVWRCGTTDQTWQSQNFKIDGSGAFHEVWAPSEPNTMVVNGTMTLPTATDGATVSAAMNCVSGAAAGSFTASWNGTQYDGTYSFAESSGNIAIVGLTWISSNPSVATVSPGGIVTAVAAGDATITAIFGSQCWLPAPGVNSCRGTTTATAAIHVSATGVGAPGRPTITQAQASGGVLTVGWTAGAGAVPTSHWLDFFAGAALVGRVITGADTSVAIQIPPGTAGAFTVTVTPFNGATVGSASNPFAFSVGGAPCAKPAVVTLTGGVANGVASVTWTAGGAASFIVQAGTMQGGANLFPPTNLGAATGASAVVGSGFQAWVRVAPVNACGQAGTPHDVFIH
jgi:hypothetical protein